MFNKPGPQLAAHALGGTANRAAAPMARGASSAIRNSPGLQKLLRGVATLIAVQAATFVVFTLALDAPALTWLAQGVILVVWLWRRSVRRKARQATDHDNAHQLAAIIMAEVGMPGDWLAVRLDALRAEPGWRAAADLLEKGALSAGQLPGCSAVTEHFSSNVRAARVPLGVRGLMSYAIPANVRPNVRPPVRPALAAPGADNNGHTGWESAPPPPAAPALPAGQRYVVDDSIEPDPLDIELARLLARDGEQ